MSNDVSKVNWTNFFVASKFAKNSEGHLPADRLWERILVHGGNEAYYCAFDLEKRETFKGYSGVARPALGLVSFDFDGADALKECREFVAWLGVSDVAIFFSGSKGFHVGVPADYFGLEVNAALPSRLGDLAAELNKRWPTLDTTVYNANRKFRVPGSKHDKTGLYKTQLAVSELHTLDLDAIKARAGARGKLWLPDVIARVELPQLTAMLHATKDKTYGTLSGDKTDFTPFEKQKGKKCIEAMLKDRAPNGHKQNTALVIISDLYNTGVHMRDAIKTMDKWCKDNDIKDDKVSRTVEQVYGGDGYSYGCNDEYKRAKCSGKCVVFKCLSPETRPKVIDAPAALRKESALSEKDVALNILNDFKGDLATQNGCLFLYTGTHWIELKKFDQIPIKQKIQNMLERESMPADSGTVESIFKTLTYHIPNIPRQIPMFSPSPLAANFLNGTLHLVREMTENTYKYSLNFMPHKKEDYVINVLPFEYNNDWSEKNTEFLAMLDRIFGDDEDKAEKIRAVGQMYGACLVPIFPHIFYYDGAGTTGKSSIIKIAMKLVSQENLSGVQPTQFHSFYMETMVGKLINAVTDVTTNQPIVDSQVKQIVDRTPMLVNRKYDKMVFATLPAIHIFGGNGIPMTEDGTSGAHERRWTFIKCNHAQVKTGELYNKEFSEWVWEHGPRGVLNFALMGLRDLLDSLGHYVMPSSGKEKMSEWLTEADPVAQFLNDIKHGEVDYNGLALSLCDPLQGSISQKKLYDSFFTWGESSGYKNKIMNRTLFNSALDSKKIMRCVINGEHRRRGIISNESGKNGF